MQNANAYNDASAIVTFKNYQSEPVTVTVHLFAYMTANNGLIAFSLPYPQLANRSVPAVDPIGRPPGKATSFFDYTLPQEAVSYILYIRTSTYHK